MFAKFSPDGRRVAYVRDNNLYVEDLADGTDHPAHDRRLGHDGSTARSTGSTRRSSRSATASAGAPTASRSPTGRSTRRACRITCSSTRPTASIPSSPRSATRRSARRTRRAASAWSRRRAARRAGWTSRATRATTTSPGWTGPANSDELVLQHLNRLQNTDEVMLADADDRARSGRSSTERDDAWVDVVDDLHWIDDGRRFTWISERDGWRHLYVVPRDGGEPRLVTPGDFDVIDVVRVDEKAERGRLPRLARRPDAALPLPGARSTARRRRDGSRPPTSRDARLPDLARRPLGGPHLFDASTRPPVDRPGRACPITRSSRTLADNAAVAGEARRPEADADRVLPGRHRRRASSSTAGASSRRASTRRRSTRCSSTSTASPPARRCSTAGAAGTTSGTGCSPSRATSS